MSLAKFADDVRWIRAQNEIWCIHMHKRTGTGTCDMATAVVLTKTTSAAVREFPAIDVDRRGYARVTSFGPATRSCSTDISLLRLRAGGPAWSKPDEGWFERPREILGCVIDIRLLSRALRTVQSTGRVKLEIAPMKGGQLLRVVARDWRIVVAGRLEEFARHFSLKAA